MPTRVKLSEDAVRRASPDDQVLASGRDLVKGKKFRNASVSPDGGWLLAECKGSGQKPYQVSVDLAAEPLVGRCSCPSRKFPCKHAVGLMLLYVADPDGFAEREPPAELVAKRDKAATRAEKKASGEEAKPRKVNTAALAKKALAQKEGLDLLEKLLIDLIAGGPWLEKSRLERLDRQAKQMNDMYLKGAFYRLRRLVLIGRDSKLGEEERTAEATDVLAWLWATVQKGRNYLDGKLAEDETQSEADAVMEEVLGRDWRLTELIEKGYARKDLRLYELAYEQTDDDAREEHIQTSHLLELGDGALLQATQFVPYKARQHARPQESYIGVVAVGEAAVYPGFVNRRVRWEPTAASVKAATAKDLKAVCDRAAPKFETALTAFRQQMKNPLASREAVFLLKCQSVGRDGDRVMVADSAGQRIECVDPRRDYSHTANLLRAGGELRKQPCLCARLIVRPLSQTIVAHPLALIQPEKHLRLGI